MKNRFMYEAEFEKNEDGYTVSYPQLPGAFTQGDDLAEAVDCAVEVLQLEVASLLDAGKQLPAPVFVGHSDDVLRIVVSVDVSPEFIERTKCVTQTEAASMLGLSKGRISHMLDSGGLQSVPFGNERLVTLASINERKANPVRAGRPKKNADK